MHERRSILIVEDDMDINQALQVVLEMEGFKTLLAFNGKQALSVLSSAERPDWILLDLMMPEMDGYEFLETVYQPAYTKKTPIIIISAAPDAHRVAESYGVKAIPKPVDLRKLLETIRAEKPL